MKTFTEISYDFMQLLRRDGIQNPEVTLRFPNARSMYEFQNVVSCEVMSTLSAMEPVKPVPKYPEFVFMGVKYRLACPEMER